MNGRVVLKLIPLIALLMTTAQAAPLHLVITDSETKTVIPARVRLRDKDGKDHVPEDAVVVKIGHEDQWFACSGELDIDVPVGPLEIRVEHGAEYAFHKETMEIAADVTNLAQVELKRWINMRDRGYTCSDNHLHVPLEKLGPQLAAEGLDFGTSLQWWDGPQFKVDLEEGFLAPLEFAGRTIPTSAYDFEIERGWGAVYVIGMPRPLEAEKDEGRPNLPLLKQAREAGALICYQGGWSREVLLDALLGYVDVVNVCNNNFHRHRFQPRSKYSNLLDVPGFPRYADDPQGMIDLNTETYYRLLNIGLQIAAGAGSATGVKPSPVGFNRAYVQTGEEGTYKQFIDAWRAGRNLVTNGPMPFVTVDVTDTERTETHTPGDVIDLPEGGGDLTITVEVLSDAPMASVELIINGEVQAKVDKFDDVTNRTKGSIQRKVTEGSWIAVRAQAQDRLLEQEDLDKYDQGEQAKPNRILFGHTSPVYVRVGGKLARKNVAVAEALAMLGALENYAKEHIGEKWEEEFKEAIQQARQKLKS